MVLFIVVLVTKYDNLTVHDDCYFQRMGGQKGQRSLSESDMLPFGTRAHRHLRASVCRGLQSTTFYCNRKVSARKSFTFGRYDSSCRLNHGHIYSTRVMTAPKVQNPVVRFL